MPLTPSKTPPLPTYLPMSDPDDWWRPPQLLQGHLHSAGKTYSLSPNPGAQVIVLPPSVPGTASAVAMPRLEPGTLRPGQADGLRLPPGTDEAAQRQPTLRVSRWARTFLNGARQSIANTAHTHMIEHGSAWKRAAKENAPGCIQTFSARNHAQLQAELKTLSTLEKDFFARFMTTPLIAVHCTQATPETPNGELCLYSRKRLEAANIPFNQDNSSLEDRTQLGNDDFVFFSLETGLTPQKPKSAFGRNRYAVDFEHPRFQEFGWLSMTEMLFPVTPWLEKHIPDLDESEYAVLSHRCLIETDQVIFAGSHMKSGIALSIIGQARRVSLPTQEKLLACKDHDRINALMNGLFRPELKVPRYFISSAFQKSELPEVLPPK